MYKIELDDGVFEEAVSELIAGGASADDADSNCAGSSCCASAARQRGGKSDDSDPTNPPERIALQNHTTNYSTMHAVSFNAIIREGGTADVYDGHSDAEQYIDWTDTENLLVQNINEIRDNIIKAVKSCDTQDNPYLGKLYELYDKPIWPQKIEMSGKRISRK